MSKLSKQVKSDLIKRAVNVIFLDKFKALDGETSALIEKALTSYPPYLSAKSKVESMTADERDTVYLGYCHTISKITTPGTESNFYLNDKYIVRSERSIRYPRTNKGVRVMTHRMDGKNFTTDHDRIAIDSDHPLRKDAEALRDKYNDLFSLIGDIEKVVNSANTSKQLQELSPQLYSMLPKTAAANALIPAESVCRVNELLSGKDLT